MSRGGAAHRRVVVRMARDEEEEHEAGRGGSLVRSVIPHPGVSSADALQVGRLGGSEFRAQGSGFRVQRLDV